MSTFLALLVATATAAFAVNEAMPRPVGATEDGDVEIEEVIDPSPLLETAVVVQLDAAQQRMAYARLVGGLMIAGTCVGLVMIGVGKVLGLVLARFARG